MLVALASNAWGFEVPSERTTWFGLGSVHFFIVSDTSRGKVHDTALDLERLVAAIGFAAPLLARRSILPTQVVMISSSDQFEEYCTAAKGKSCKGLAGVFLRGRHGNYLLVSATRFADARVIACHELTHSIFHNFDEKLPVWLDEGLAELYSSVAPVGHDTVLGVREERHLRTLYERGLMPVAQLLAVGYDSPEYTQPDLMPLFYAESWLMVHYMLLGPSRSSAHLADYLTRVMHGEDREQAFRAAFGMGTTDFTKQLAGYMQEPRMNHLSIRNAALALSMIPEARPLPRDEAMSVLAEPLVDFPHGDLGIAKRLLAEARQANPASPRAAALLASALCRTGGESEATGLFEEAVRSPAAGAFAPLVYAEHLLDRGARDEGDDAARDLARARDLLQAALAAEPENFCALIARGRSYAASRSQDVAAGIQALEHALQLAPWRGDAAVILAILLGRAGQVDRAIAVVKQYVLTSPDAVTRGEGPALMAHLHSQAARLAVQEGRLADAAAALEAALAASDSPEARNDLRSQLRGIRDRISYNAAIGLANKGDVAGAQAALDRLIPQLADANLRAAAIAFRSSLAAGAAPPPAPTVTTDGLVLPPVSARDAALRREAMAQREAERYNEAAALASRGKLKEALAIAEDLAKNASNETVKTAAIGLAQRLAARLAKAQ
jgi:tetratricopeptide (TPR) repeat protein